MDETWLYHYDSETKQQWMEWRLSGSPCPKNSECENRLEKFSPRFFFWVRTASSTLIIFQRAKLSRRSITHLCWCNWSNFEGKTPREVTKGVIFLHAMPRLTGHLQLRRNWPTLASTVLITHSILRSGPVALPPVTGLKNQLKIRHSSSYAEVIAAAETWLDGQLSEFFFFEMLA